MARRKKANRKSNKPAVKPPVVETAADVVVIDLTDDTSVDASPSASSSLPPLKRDDQIKVEESESNIATTSASADDNNFSRCVSGSDSSSKESCTDSPKRAEVGSDAEEQSENPKAEEDGKESASKKRRAKSKKDASSRAPATAAASSSSGSNTTNQTKNNASCSCEGCMRKPCGICGFCRADKRCVFGQCKNQRPTTAELITFRRTATDAVQREPERLQQAYDYMFSKTGWVYFRMHGPGEEETTQTTQPAKQPASSKKKEGSGVVDKTPQRHGGDNHGSSSVESSPMPSSPKLIQRKVYESPRPLRRKQPAAKSINKSPARSPSLPRLPGGNDDDDDTTQKPARSPPLPRLPGASKQTLTPSRGRTLKKLIFLDDDDDETETSKSNDEQDMDGADDETETSKRRDEQDATHNQNYALELFLGDNSVSATQKANSLKTVATVLRNLNDPAKAGDPKYRQLRLENARIKQTIVSHDPIMSYLELIGFESDQDERVLRYDTPTAPVLTLSVAQTQINAALERADKLVAEEKQKNDAMAEEGKQENDAVAEEEEQKNDAMWEDLAPPPEFVDAKPNALVNTSPFSREDDDDDDDDEGMVSARENEDDEEMHSARQDEPMSSSAGGTDTEYEDAVGYESAVGSPSHQSGVSSITTPPPIANKKETVATTKSSTSKSRTSRCYRCNECDGCRQADCGFCQRCDVARPCCFRPCTRFSDNTLMGYRSTANVLVKKLRDENGKSPVDALFQKFYGAQGWVAVRLGSGGGDDEFGTPKEEQQHIDTDKQPMEEDEGDEQWDSPMEADEEQQTDSESPSVAAMPTEDMPKKSSGRYSKARCGECEGCRREMCGRCPSCKDKSYCVFKACTSYSYSSSTMQKYRRDAVEAVEGNGDDDDDDDSLQVSFDTIYGPEGWMTKIMEFQNVGIPTRGGSTKKARGSRGRGRCGTCNGCSRDKCGKCPSCTGSRSTTTACAFGLCTNFSYAVSTLETYRKLARETLSRDASSEIQELYEEIYGEQGFVTRLEQANASGSAASESRTRNAAGSCGTCGNCGRDACGLCSLCKSNSKAHGGCVFKICLSYLYSSPSTMMKYQKLAREAVESNPQSSEIIELYEEIYGNDGLETELRGSGRDEDKLPGSNDGDVTGGKTPKKARGARCGKCAGCRREKCDVCSSCQGRTGYTACVFNLCSNYDYAPSTMANYTRVAKEAVRQNAHSRAICELYNEVYGDLDSPGSLPERDRDKAVVVTKAVAKKTKNHPCGACAGCSEDKCGLCPCCTGASNYAACLFKICRKVSYAASTLENRRRMADSFLAKSGASNEIRELYEPLYGRYGWLTKLEEGADVDTGKASVSTPKNGRSRRCGDCDGCNAVACGQCHGCRGMGPTTRPCGFKPCRRLEAATLRNYRQSAYATTERLRDEDGKSPLDERYDFLYGEQGWATKVIEGSCQQENTAVARLSSSVASRPEPEKSTRNRSRCGVCAGCIRKKCGHCKPCRREGNGNNTRCAFNLCRNADYAASTLIIYRAFGREAVNREGSRALIAPLFQEVYGDQGWVTHALKGRKTDSTGQNGKEVSYRVAELRPGDRVYCRWPENDLWYWGKIVSRSHESGEELYHVRFDDGDERPNVPPDEMVTVEEYEESENEKSQGTKRKRASTSQERVGRSVSDDQSSRSRNLKVGSRCYAKYKNGDWYWGNVTKITGSGKTRMFSVKFEDGDQLDGIASFSVMSEQAFLEETGSDPPPPKRRKGDQEHVRRLNTRELRSKRCKKCAMCTRKDCGSCEACRTNRRQTSVAKECCLLKMCSNLSVEQKQQPISPVFSGWKFYFTDPDTLPWHLTKEKPAHPSLSGLVIVRRSGDKHRSILRAATASNDTVGVTHNAFVDAASDFYEHKLGVTMTEEINHPLLRRGYHRQWRDFRGEVKEVYGRITKCTKSLLNGALHFTVTYDASSCDLLRPFALLHQSKVASEKDQIEEADAWGGYRSFAEVTGTEIDISLPFHRRFIVPVTRREDRYSSNGLPVLNFHVKGFKVELEARQSGIPGGGLGLWLTCKPLSPMTKRKYFELKAGEVVDIGVYAPLQVQDCKHDHISLLKNFVFDWKIEGWNYDSIVDSRSNVPVAADVFDITDDQTGDLHELARKNIVVYTNETDGKETPTIWASHDPEGSVHYHLGHSEENHRSLKIRADGQPVELKIDYGPRYESVRVKKGYSRLKGAELEARKKTVLEEDSEMIRELQESSVQEIRESVDFLDSVFASPSPLNSGEVTALVRSLAATIALQQRLVEICHKFESMGHDSDDDEDGDDERSFCDNGYSTIQQDGTVTNLSNLIKQLCGLFPHGNNQMLSELLAKSLYRTLLTQSLGLASTDDLDGLSPGELRERIEDFADQLEVDDGAALAAAMDMEW